MKTLCLISIFLILTTSCESLEIVHNDHWNDFETFPLAPGLLGDMQQLQHRGLTRFQVNIDITHKLHNYSMYSYEGWFHDCVIIGLS